MQKSLISNSAHVGTDPDPKDQTIAVGNAYGGVYWMKGPIAMSLQGDFGSGGFEFGLHILGFRLRYGLTNRLRSGFDEFLRLLQTETGDFANCLDDVDLVGAHFNQFHVELGLLLDHGSLNLRRDMGLDGGLRLDTPFLFKLLGEGDDFDDRHLTKLLHDLFHDDFLSVVHFTLLDFW